MFINPWGQTLKNIPLIDQMFVSVIHFGIQAQVFPIYESI